MERGHPLRARHRSVRPTGDDASAQQRTCGNRRDGGIETRLSTDEGKVWSEPRRLFTTGPGDMGYPGTAQLPDGKLVSDFYAIKSPLHDGYHMGRPGGLWKKPPFDLIL